MRARVAVVLAAVALSACRADDSKPDRAACEGSVFLQPGTTTERTQEVSRRLNSLLPKSKIHFVDQDEAYAEYQELFKDNEDLGGGMVAPEDMPTSFRIGSIQRGEGSMLKSALADEPSVDKVVVPSNC
jgi:hypothetical protein